VVLRIGASHEALLGEAVARRLRLVGIALGLDARVVLD
jgi:hypothetical protein